MDNHATRGSRLRCGEQPGSFSSRLDRVHRPQSLMTNIPRGDPLKPRSGRREPGARSVRGPKLAEDLTVTAAAHTLDGHTGSLTKSRLDSTPLVEEVDGGPTHTA